MNEGEEKPNGITSGTNSPMVHMIQLKSEEDQEKSMNMGEDKLNGMSITDQWLEELKSEEWWPKDKTPHPTIGTHPDYRLGRRPWIRDMQEKQEISVSVNMLKLTMKKAHKPSHTHPDIGAQSWNISQKAIHLWYV